MPFGVRRLTLPIRYNWTNVGTMNVVDISRRQTNSDHMSAEQNPSARNMSGFKLADVSVVMADSRSHLRTLMKSAFLEIGIRQVHDASRMDQIADCLSMNDAPDLLICDAGMSHAGGHQGNH